MNLKPITLYTIFWKYKCPKINSLPDFIILFKVILISNIQSIKNNCLFIQGVPILTAVVSVFKADY